MSEFKSDPLKLSTDDVLSRQLHSPHDTSSGHDDERGKILYITRNPHHTPGNTVIGLMSELFCFQALYCQSLFFITFTCTLSACSFSLAIAQC